MSFIINLLDKWDKESSSKIHKMGTSLSMELSLFIPVRFFQPHVFPFILVGLSVLFPYCELEIL